MDNLKLTKGTEYPVKLSPSDQVVTAKYIGRLNIRGANCYIFSNSTGYQFVRSRFASQESGTISHLFISSAPVENLPRTSSKDSKLLESLQELEAAA